MSNTEEKCCFFAILVPKNDILGLQCFEHVVWFLISNSLAF